MIGQEAPLAGLPAWIRPSRPRTSCTAWRPPCCTRRARTTSCTPAWLKWRSIPRAAPGLIEAPVAHTLMRSIVSQGFCTAALPFQGTAIMAGRPPNQKLTDACAWQAPYVVHGKSVAPLFSIFHVKGWRRAVAAATVATLAMQGDALTLDSLPPHVAVSLTTAHVLLKFPASLRESIDAGRRITMTSAATRLRPNCFNHMHQLMLLRLEGGGDCHVEARQWNKNIMEAPAPNAKQTASKL